MFHVYTQLNRKYNSILTFDPTYFDISEDYLMKFDWKCLSGDFKASIPSNEPEIKEKWIDLIIQWTQAMQVKILKDVQELVFVIFVNIALIQWFYIHQPIIEIYMFGRVFRL